MSHTDTHLPLRRSTSAAVFNPTFVTLVSLAIVSFSAGFASMTAMGVMALS